MTVTASSTRTTATPPGHRRRLIPLVTKLSLSAAALTMPVPLAVCVDSGRAGWSALVPVVPMGIALASIVAESRGAVPDPVTRAPLIPPAIDATGTAVNGTTDDVITVEYWWSS